MSSADVTILGGGVCGLYAAHTACRLGAHVQLVEKGKSLGGLAAGHRLGENWYDLGVHMLHAFDAEIFQDCAEVMGEERIEVPLKSHIQWQGKTYHYPLRGRDILSGIAPLTLARCLLGLGIAELRSRFSAKPHGTDAESALIELYGVPLYEFFFEDFTHRYWGRHPRSLDAEFIRRKMPRLSAVDVLKNGLEKLGIAKPRDAREGAMRFETLHYSRTGAEAMPRLLGESLQSAGVTMLTGETIIEIHHDENSITEVVTGNKILTGTDFVSTLPLPDLVHCLHPAAPPDVLDAANQLRFKPLTIYALLIRKDRCMDALYTYYRDQVFHRVGEPKNAGLEVTPAGHTTLIVETTCEIGDRYWQGDALDEILTGLSLEGLCEPDDLVEHHLIHSAHAYPIFAHGFQKHLACVTDYLSCFKNLRTTGRQGAFTYPNMHSAMRMGAEAVKSLLQS
ncbi:MAG: FAD-dependent oxidoreductase [Verrucomicrobiae bacterium]|nr:FAD-dependent oxidoreductase [Verrucomicrobiae bacterium]NNJ43242.1 NAD(P)-binding protein [Akkermansiaceae bacterium]